MKKNEKAHSPIDIKGDDGLKAYFRGGESQTTTGEILHQPHEKTCGLVQYTQWQRTHRRADLRQNSNRGYRTKPQKPTPILKVKNQLLKKLKPIRERNLPSR
jgi:hypothetical protein